MALYKSAQAIEIDDTSDVSSEERLNEHKLGEGDVVLFEEMPSPEDVIEVHRPQEHAMEVSFSLPLVPGAPDAEPLEVSSDDVIEVEEKKDKNDLQGQGKAMEVLDPWDHKSAADVIAWAVERLQNLPKHSGKDIAGCERVIAAIKKIKAAVSDAMRNDLSGKLDASSVEKLCAEMDDGIERLEDRIDALEGEKTQKRKKKSALQADIVKEGQKATHVGGIIITVPLLISRIARVCINGSVSAGHSIEDLFAQQVKKYKLSDREQAETLQLLEDMNYPVRRDRIYLLDEKQDIRDGKGDFGSQYTG